MARGADIDRRTGTYSAGAGRASGALAHLCADIGKLVGLPPMERGTFNVQLEEHYPLTAVDGVIGPQEYRHQDECIKVRRCRVRRAEHAGVGVRAVLVRPSQHEDPGRPHWCRLELMSHRRLSAALGVGPGEKVVVEIEAEAHRNPGWWAASDALER